MSLELPFVSADIPPIPGIFRSTPEDFVVTEVPAYEPAGHGDHVFVWFEKRGLTTPDAVRDLATHAGAKVSDCSWAGLKDRHAVTRQWASIYGIVPEAIAEVRTEGLTVLRVARHPKKLRTGHLRGNRFELRVRETPTDRFDDVRRVLDVIGRTGLPNYFGEQRFGRQGQNVERANDWIVRGGRAPTSRFQRKLLLSVWQAALFNRHVASRMRDQGLGQVVQGDLMKKEDTGGLFTADDPVEAQQRADRWEISATGPMFGAKMRWPNGEARTLEQALLDSTGVDETRLRALARQGAGTRRVVRVRPAQIELRTEGEALWLGFTLPKGSYATVVLQEILKRRAEPPKKS